MAIVSRQVLDGEIEQGRDETKTYTVTVSPTPTAVVGVYVFNKTSLDDDIKATHMPTGSASIGGNVITLPPLTGLLIGQKYRVEVRWTDGVNILENYIWFRCDR